MTDVDTTIYDLGHESTLTGAPDDGWLIPIISTTDPSAPLLSSVANLRAAFLAAVTVGDVPAWDPRSGYDVGQLVHHVEQLWWCHTEVTAPADGDADNPPPRTASGRWHAVVTYQGRHETGRWYEEGQIVKEDGRHWFSTVDHNSTTANAPTASLGHHNWSPLYRQIYEWAADTYVAAGDHVQRNQRTYLALASGYFADPPAGDNVLWVDLSRPGPYLWAQQGNQSQIPASKLANVPAFAAWAGDTNSDPIPADKLANAPASDPPALRSSYSTTQVTIRYDGDATGAAIPLAHVGQNPYAGLMAPAEKTKLDTLADVTPRGAWNGNQREYGVGDLVHRHINNYAVVAWALSDHTSSSTNGPTQQDTTRWATLLAVPRSDWDAGENTPSGIRNKPTIPDAHTITTHMLNFDTAGIHSGHGENYWHRTNVLASAVPAGSEVCFELPYTWSPPPRLWSRWPGAPTQVAQEWWLEDYSPDGGTTVIDRIPAPDSSFTTGGSTHYHPMGYIDTESHPRTVETREIALIVDGGGYLCFWTGVRPVVGDHGSTARAAGVRMLWRSM